MPGRFSSGQSRRKRRRCRATCARIRRRSMSASPEAIGAGKKSCATSTSSWRLPRPRRLRRHSSGIRWSESIIAQGPTKSSVRLRSGIQCDLRVVSDDGISVRAELFHRQQGAQHRPAQSRAPKRVDVERISPCAVRTERAAPGRNIAARYSYQVRDEAGTLSRARARLHPAGAARELRRIRGGRRRQRLPRLVEAENLRGTFHCHTTASDGHNTLEEMAAAAQELGLQYLGIADHSRSSIQAHGLDAGAAAASRSPRSASSISNSRTSGSSPASSATSSAMAPSIFPTRSWRNSITSSPQSIPLSRFRKRT